MLVCLWFQCKGSSIVVSFYVEGIGLAVLGIRLFYQYWLATLLTALTVTSLIHIIPYID
jgi:hypothetical protein